MKTLNIKSNIGRRLAAIALFERLQAFFNLHPQKLAAKARALAKKENKPAIHLVSRVQEYAPAWLAHLLIGAYHEIDGTSDWGAEEAEVTLFNNPEAFDACQYLDWSAHRFAKEIKSKAKAEELDPKAFCSYLCGEAPKIVSWALEQTILILKQDKK